MTKDITRAEALLLGLFKELRRIGILSEHEMQRVVSNYVDMRTMIPPNPSIDEVADEPFSMMLVMMADDSVKERYMKEASRRQEAES